MSETVVLFKRPIRWNDLRADEAERIIKEWSQETEKVFFTDHAFDRVDERSLLQQDVYRVLREGYVDLKPVKDENDNWVVRVKKRIRGGREAGVVTVVLREEEKLLIVTVMWVDT